MSALEKKNEDDTHKINVRFLIKYIESHGEILCPCLKSHIYLEDKWDNIIFALTAM